MSVALDLPTATTLSICRHRNCSLTRWYIESDIKMLTPYCLHIASRRDARLTSSPIRPHSICDLDPMFPCSTDPTLIPMRACTAGRPSASQRSRRVAMMCCCRSADAQAAFVWSATSNGEFQKDSIPSPMYLPTVPLLSWMQSLIASRYSASRLMSRSGSSVSAIVVKPAMSENMIETSCGATPSTATSFWLTRRRVTVSGTYRAKD
mmetsp:Transcript_82736/g.124205  ORF Transcript_82736/g.124205 Transcript_82736/m.124205 type:complete len:207 (+) Transcript_82736:378-998(+)